MWNDLWNNIKNFFTDGIKYVYPSLIIEFILFALGFYYLYKVFKANKANSFIYIFTLIILAIGVIAALCLEEEVKFIAFAAIVLITLLMYVMFGTEIKRMATATHGKKRRGEHLMVSGVELIIEEAVRAVQNMSKKNIGALIVLANDNLPEGIMESGTVINADINAEMIEAVFYPKAPLHDGAMIIEGTKIYAAGCFLPIIQNENLPQEMGSRHRAALGVTTVANVTVIVVSEETGIISIVKNGAIRKKYADAADLKNALSDYYWSDLTAEGKL